MVSVLTILCSRFTINYRRKDIRGCMENQFHPLRSPFCILKVMIWSYLQLSLYIRAYQYDRRQRNPIIWSWVCIDRCACKSGTDLRYYTFWVYVTESIKKTFWRHNEVHTGIIVWWQLLLTHEIETCLRYYIIIIIGRFLTEAVSYGKLIEMRHNLSIHYFAGKKKYPWTDRWWWRG